MRRCGVICCRSEGQQRGRVWRGGDGEGTKTDNTNNASEILQDLFGRSPGVLNSLFS